MDLRKVLLFSALDGVVSSAGALAALGSGGVWLARELAPGLAWRPGWLWLGLSLAAPLSILAFALRMRPRPGRPLEDLEWLGPGAGLFLAVVVVTACLANALGVAEPVFLVCLGGIPLIGAAATWAVHADVGLRRRAIAAVVLLLTLLSVLFTGWPIRATVWLCGSSLQGLGARIERGETVATPTWIGPFRIAEIDRPYMISQMNGPPIDAGAFLVTCHTLSGRAGLMTAEDAKRWSLGWNRRVSARWSFVFED